MIEIGPDQRQVGSRGCATLAFEEFAAQEQDQVTMVKAICGANRRPEPVREEQLGVARAQRPLRPVFRASTFAPEPGRREQPHRITRSSFDLRDRTRPEGPACENAGRVPRRAPASWRRRVEARPATFGLTANVAFCCVDRPGKIGRKVFTCELDVLIGLVSLLDPPPFPVELGHHFKVIDFERIHVRFGLGLTGFDFFEGTP